MDDSWRFRPTIQSNPPPPFSHPHPHPHPPPYIHYSTVRPPPPPYEFLDLDPLRKRMRVEDPNPQRPPAWDNERRLSLIREHGRQDPANIGVDHCRFDSLPNYQNFDSSYQNLQERRGFYEYGDNSYQNLQERRDVYEYDRQILEKEHDRPFHHNERSSYSLPKQNSYETMPRIPNYEQGRYPPNVGNEIRKLPFDANHFSHVPYESSDYRVHSSQMYPPLPPQPPLPPPPPPESSPPPSFGVRPLVAAPPHMLAPVPVKVSGHLFPTPPVSQGSLEARSMGQSGFYSEMPVRNINGFVSEGLPLIHQTPSKEYPEGREQAFSLRNSVKDKATVIDACHLFRQPHRASRPDHIVVILRGLPGSGKSYLAKALRDLEVETGGNAPRIHAMDDYFMIEVEKVEDNDGSKCSGSSRGRKQTIKKVIEYCYEPELEEAYRSSMMKAFKKTLDEGNFTFIIVDDRNLRVADFAQFWAIAKRSGYEVYLLEATYKDPTGCAARNVHGFTVEEIRKMADQWEEAPSLYLQLNIQSLFCGDNLNERSIQEVDMDTDDTACDNEEPHMSIQREDSRIEEPKSSKHTLDSGIVKIGERWNSDDEEDELIGVKKLGNSKWSKDEVDDVRSSDGARRNLSALSGLIQAYGKGGKTVHWGDKVGKSGFSIGVVKKQNPSSLIIGPGSGYNLSSNPIQEDDDALKTTEKRNINDSKNRFTLQLRAERESFKAVFDRRRQRIGGLWDVDDE